MNGSYVQEVGVYFFEFGMQTLQNMQKNKEIKKRHISEMMLEQIATHEFIEFGFAYLDKVFSE